MAQNVDLSQGSIDRVKEISAEVLASISDIAGGTKEIRSSIEEISVLATGLGKSSEALELEVNNLRT